jgi:ABC-type uncharacterized transport system involved in gliding motility auxiliary subunit
VAALTMERSFRFVLTLLAGLALLGTSAAVYAVFLETKLWSGVLLVVGLALTGYGVWGLRAEFAGMVRQRRGEIALYALGVVGVFAALAYLSAIFPVRIDMSSQGMFSLSPQTVNMLQRLERPVHVTFFHDPMMRETVELYKLMAANANGKVTVEFIDPMLNPAQARRRGVEFAGTAIMESENRRLTVNGPTETDVANGILRVSQTTQQQVCFLDGHQEPDPFSLESHDHSEGDAGHSHGLGSKLVVHQRHGMAKARNSLEALNYQVRKVLLVNGNRAALDGCSLLVVAGPKLALLPQEVQAISAYVDGGGNGLFMLDPFVKAGLEPLLRSYGIVVDDDIVIDEASHFWTDVSAPAVTEYNVHQVTQELPLTFFPGVRSLSPTPERVPTVSVRPLINTSARSWTSTDPDKAEFNADKNERKPNTIMVVANRRPEFQSSAEAVMRELRGEKPAQDEQQPKPRTDIKPARIVVVGDSDFATNSFYNVMGNGKLFLNTVNYLAARENLIGIEPRTFDRPQVSLTNQQMKGTVFLSMVLIPALMALIGVAVWWRQR